MAPFLGPVFARDCDRLLQVNLHALLAKRLGTKRMLLPAEPHGIVADQGMDIIILNILILVIIELLDVLLDDLLGNLFQDVKTDSKGGASLLLLGAMRRLLFIMW